MSKFTSMDEVTRALRDITINTVVQGYPVLQNRDTDQTNIINVKRIIKWKNLKCFW